MTIPHQIPIKSAPHPAAFTFEDDDFDDALSQALSGDEVSRCVMMDVDLGEPILADLPQPAPRRANARRTSSRRRPLSAPALAAITQHGVAQLDAGAVAMIVALGLGMLTLALA